MRSKSKKKNNPMMSQNNDNAKKEARLLLEIVMKTYLSAFQYISCRKFI